MEHKEDVDITLDVSVTYPLDQDYLTYGKLVHTYGHSHERLTQTETKTTGTLSTQHVYSTVCKTVCGGGLHCSAIFDF